MGVFGSTKRVPTGEAPAQARAQAGSSLVGRGPAAGGCAEPWASPSLR